MLAATATVRPSMATRTHAPIRTPARVIILKTRDHAFYNAAAQGFLNGLKKRGYPQGERVEVRVYALTGKSPEQDTRLVRSLVAQHPRLLVTLGTDATRSAAEQKPDFPTLFSLILDPVGLGIVKSLEQPGGLFAGSTLLVNPGKQLDMLLQVCPSVRRVGVLYTDGDPTSLGLLREASEDAMRLSLVIAGLSVKSGQSAREVLAGAHAEIDAFWVIPDPASSGPQALRETLEYARQKRKPVLGTSATAVRLGALVALSANLEDLGDVTAEMAIPILEGIEAPARMRVRGPRKTLLSINLDSARSLGLTFSSALLGLAEEVTDSQQEKDP